ncbi:hypothetical protein O1L68_42130 [Streptomyces lydicus]|nr:hypothetical protein [Streptomyces lydicus]
MPRVGVEENTDFGEIRDNNTNRHTSQEQPSATTSSTPTTQQPTPGPSYHTDSDEPPF